MMGRLKPVQEQQIPCQDQGKEPKEIKDLLSKTKLGDLLAIYYFRKIDSRCAGFFAKVSDNPVIKEMKQDYIDCLTSWITYQSKQIIGQSSKSGRKELQSLLKFLERRDQYSKFRRFHFLPKQVQIIIQELQKKVEEVIQYYFAAVKDCIFPQKNNNRLKNNHTILKDIFAKLKLIKTNSFFNKGLFQAFEECLFFKKRLLKEYLQSFKNKPENFQQFHELWEQAKLLDFIQSDNDKNIFQLYFGYLSEHFKQEMKVLKQCAGNFPHFRYAFIYMMTKFKDFLELDLEQEFLKAINYFQEVQWEFYSLIRQDYQLRHKLLKDLFEFRQKIALYLPINVGKLINSIVCKDLKSIRSTLRMKSYPQEVLMKYKKMCKEMKDQFGQMHPSIEKLRSNVLALLEKKREELQGNGEKLGEREKKLKRKHDYFKSYLGLQGSKGYQKTNIFVGTGVFSFYDKNDWIHHILINNSQVCITSADGKSENDSCQGREVINKVMKSND